MGCTRSRGKGHRKPVRGKACERGKAPRRKSTQERGKAYKSGRGCKQEGESMRGKPRMRGSGKVGGRETEASHVTERQT